MILRLGQKRQTQIGKPFPPVQSAEECLQLFDAQTFSWSVAPEAYVHLGVISDPHHQYCYRAKNMFDRARANSLPNVTTQNFQPGVWQKMQSIATSLTTKPIIGGGGFPSPLVHAIGKKAKASVPVYRLPSPVQ
jgi:hypothetical protein